METMEKSAERMVVKSTHRSRNDSDVCVRQPVLQTLQLVLFLCKLRLGSFLVGSELFKGFRFCHCD